MISEAQYFDSAQSHNLEITTIKAVAAVESGGKAFLADGKPVILFEPHVFCRELKARKIDVTKLPAYNTDILYEKWGAKPYGPSTSQHEKLERAVKIHREAALCSASWGRFQIMGFNHTSCGCHTIQEFINAIYKSEDEHLRLFMNFVKSTGLDRYLRAKDWPAFAKGYNGAGYKENRYDTKLANAYDALRSVTVPRSSL